MNILTKIEESFCALEELLGVSLTLIDNKGYFHDMLGRGLFTKERQSHQKNRICEIGFCSKCIHHCRYEMLEKAESANEAFFVHTCWKGVMELVAPIWRGEICLGLVYAGIWRKPGQKVPDNQKLLSADVGTEYVGLREFDIRQATSIGQILEIFNKGITAELDKTLFRDKKLQSRENIISEFIFKHSSLRADMGALAEELCLSPSRTSHLVKELFGKSFETLILNERMDRAKNLLSITDLPVGRIADIAGFPDQFSFSKIFARLEGCPPGKFRKHRL